MKIVNVSKNINKKDILKDISFEMKDVGIVFLMGKSGAGKSTLFNILSGIDKDFTGEIYYDGSYNCHNIEWYRQNVFGIVFQDFNLIKTLSVRDNILLGIKIAEKSMMLISTRI